MNYDSPEVREIIAQSLLDPIKKKLLYTGLARLLKVDAGLLLGGYGNGGHEITRKRKRHAFDK